MTIHQDAARIRELFIEAGETVGELMLSINRNGDHSAYFWWKGADMRISDHASRAMLDGAVRSLPHDADRAEVEREIDRVNTALAVQSVARFLRGVGAAIAADEAAAAKAAMDAAVAARRTAWTAHLATLDTTGWTATAIGKVEKAWRKANPVEAFRP